MKMAKYDDSDGVWRTIGGRRVFIRTGQSLSDAMIESGKFKNLRSDYKKAKESGALDPVTEEISKEVDEKYPELAKRVEENYNNSQIQAAKELGYDVNTNNAKEWREIRERAEEIRMGNNIKTFADEIKEKDEKESISDLYDVKETEDGYEGKGKELLKFIENEEKDSGVEISDRLKTQLKNNPDDTFIFDNENETITKTSLTDDDKANLKKLEDIINEDAKIGNTANRLKAIDDQQRYDRLHDKYADMGYSDDEFKKIHGERPKTGLEFDNSSETNKDGKYYRNRLQELDSADTPSGTYDIETGEAVDFKGKGYSVSFEQTGVELTDQQYIAKINECRDRCDGNVYFGKFGGTPEVSFHTDDINEAIKIMKENNQHSIYDIANDTEILNDEYDASTNKIKDLSQVKALTSKETKTQGEQYEDYKRAKLGLQTNEQKSTNETMNEKIRTKASKKSTFKDDLPKRTEIKTQGTSNRKEVSENIQAHILDYYDSPQDFLDQMDAMSYLPTKWKQGEELAKGGSYLIYNGDMSDFLNELKINPKGKSFSDDKAFDMYTSLIGRESAKLYDRLMKNEYNKYKQSHPLTKMTLEEFIKSRKEK